MRRTGPLLALSLPAFLFFAAPASGEDPPYPAGPSTQTIEGLQVELDLPKEMSAQKPASLVVILHGAGGTATGMAGALRTWPAAGYVVCAPKSKGQVWSPTDVEAVKRIAAHLLKSLPIDPRRVHVVGFSNGGWNLPPLAFDDVLKPRSATWVAAGCNEGGAPKWAKTGLGVLALAGSQDANADSARDTVRILRGKVRSVEVRFQPGLGHEWPTQLVPYLLWWMGAMEGRYQPGEDMNFEWTGDLEAAKSGLAGAKKGGVLVYAWSDAEAEPDAGRELQNEVFMDPAVRFYGAQIPCVKLRFEDHRAALEALGVKSAPAVVVLDVKGAPKKVLVPPFKAKNFAAALRPVAPDKNLPE
jgi:predicted esterase